MNTAGKYNGWTNHETWCVNLWLENDEPSYRYWRAAARERVSEATERHGRSKRAARARERYAACALATQMKDEIDYAKPELEGMWADLLSSAVQNVDWIEVATAWVQSLAE